MGGEGPAEEAAERLRRADELALTCSEGGILCRVSRHAPSTLSVREYLVRLGIPYEEFVRSPIEVGDYVAAVNALNLQLVLLRVEEVVRRSVDSYLGAEPPIAGEEIRAVVPASLLTPVEVAARPLVAFDYDEERDAFIEVPRGVALPLEPQSPVFRPKPQLLIKLLGLPAEGCTLGCMVTEGLRPLAGVAVKLPVKAFYQHVLITGTTGSGKTTLIKNMVASMATAPLSVVVVDSTGEYVQMVCDRPEWRGGREDEEIRRLVYGGVGPLDEVTVLLPITKDAVSSLAPSSAEDLAVKLALDYFERSLKPLGARLVRDPEPLIEEGRLKEVLLLVEAGGERVAMVRILPWALRFGEVGAGVASLSPMLTFQARNMLRALVGDYLRELKAATLSQFLEELRHASDLSVRVQQLLRGGGGLEEAVKKAEEELRRAGAGVTEGVDLLLRTILRLGVHRSTLENMIRALGSLERTGLFDVSGPGYEVVEQPYGELLSGGGVMVVDLQAYVRDAEAQRVVVYRVLERLYEYKFRAYVERRRTLPLIVVVDEAHQYFPATAARGEEEGIRMIASMLTRIARLGRRHGMGLVFATHSPQDLNPIVVQLSNTKIVLRSERRILESLGIPLEYRGLLEVAPDRVGLARSHFYRTHYVLFRTTPPLVGHLDLSGGV